jgi:hypothetical protein
MMNRSQKALIILMLSWLQCFSFAEGIEAAASGAVYEKVTASAMSTSESSATSKALANAVSQVNGAVVQQKMDIRETQDEVYMNFWGQSIHIPSSEINQGYTKSYNQGVVRRYTVLKTEYLKETDMYQVTIEAEVQAVGDFKNLGADRSKLVPIAIVPFKSKENTFVGLTEKHSAAEVGERLAEELSTGLAESGHFRVNL